MNTVAMSFGGRVRARREFLRLALDELAVRARIAPATLIDIEADAYFPRLHELERLLDALEIRLSILQTDRT